MRKKLTMRARIGMALCLWGLLLYGPYGVSSKAAAADAARERPITSTTLMSAVTEASVRRTPASDGEVVGQLKEGETLYAVEEQDGWYRVVYLGETGYVEADALKVFQSGDEWDAPSYETMPPLEVLTGSTGESGAAADGQDAGAGGQAESAEGQVEGAGGQAESAEGQGVQTVKIDAVEGTGSSGAIGSATVILIVAVAAVLGGYAIGLFSAKKEQGQQKASEEDNQGDREDEIEILDGEGETPDKDEADHTDTLL